MRRSSASAHASLALLGALLAAPAARAQAVGPTPAMAAGVRTDAPAAAPARSAARRPVFVGAALGFASASVTLDRVAESSVDGVALGLDAGVVLSPRWAVSIEMRDFQRQLVRVREGGFGTADSALHTLAGCDKCPVRGHGGSAVSLMLHLDSIGPRVDFTPLGRDGPFVGVGAGVALLSLEETSVGAAASAHGGLQVTLADVLTFAAEGGIEGQKASGADAALGFIVGTAKAQF